MLSILGLYIDVYFLENLLMDFLLLFLGAEFLKRRKSLARLILGAGLGAAGACVPVVIPLGGSIRLLLWQLILTFVMAWISYRSSKRKIFREVCVLYGMSVIMTGAISLMVSLFPLPFVPTVFLAFVLAWGILKRIKKPGRRESTMCEVTLGLEHREIKVTALLDTGNQLREPYGGKPVSVVEESCLKQWQDIHRPKLLIPYHTVGKSLGFMEGFTLDYLSIRKDGKIQRIDKPVVALSKKPISHRQDYVMLLNPFVMEDEEELL